MDNGIIGAFWLQRVMLCTFYVIMLFRFCFILFFWDQVSYLDPRLASDSEIFLLQSHRCWDISCQAQLCLFICPSYTPVNWISGSYGNSTLGPWGAVNLWELLSRTVGMYYGSLHRWAFLFCTPTTDSESWMGCNVLFPLAWNVHLTEETWAPEGEWNTSGALSHLLVQCELLMVAASSDKAAMGWSWTRYLWDSNSNVHWLLSGSSFWKLGRQLSGGVPASRYEPWAWS